MIYLNVDELGRIYKGEDTIFQPGSVIKTIESANTYCCTKIINYSTHIMHCNIFAADSRIRFYPLSDLPWYPLETRDRLQGPLN